MIEYCFWLSAIVILYAYCGFPLLTFFRGLLQRIELRRGDITPTVTIIIVAHNEAAGIRRKLDNLLALDYPRERLNIVIASDGSDDGTNRIVAEYEPSGIRLLRLPRRGKIPSLNAAASSATGEILVFSDANSMYARDGLRVLVRPFVDASVGGVAGNQSYVARNESNVAGTGEWAYWNFDQLLKRWQSEAGSVTSATGAIYAIRRTLFEPVPGGVGDDAVISYRVVARGYRLVFEPKAIAYETLSPSAGAEFKRKVRVCARGLRGVMAVPQLLNPFRYGFYSLQLFSHKLLRWLMVWPLLTLFLTSLWLRPAGGIYRIAALTQLIFYGLALAVWILRQRKMQTGKVFKILTLPFYFCLANAACLPAQLSVVRGRRIDLWEVRRSEN